MEISEINCTNCGKQIIVGNMSLSDGEITNKKINIDIEITSKIEDIPYGKLSSVPNCCGAYIITVKSGRIYVGSSKTVRTRIQSHNVHNDPNIIEDIDKVTFYLTKTHMDARILEYWLIRELNPELNFEIQPDASTWKDGSKDLLLLNTKDNTKNILEKLSKLILTLPNTKEVVRKNWITYQISKMKNFCAIKIKKDCLQVDLKIMDHTRFKDSESISFDIMSTQTWTFDRRVELYNIEQIEKTFDLIKQAYELIET